MNESHPLRRSGGAQCHQHDPLECLVGNSDAMKLLKERIRRVATLRLPILLTGESGSGKELVARAIHQLSSRREGSYVAVNAAAVPAGLVESEFFGHEPGAFTGADRRGRVGKLELANGGSLFLDEIGDMPLEVQAKLLRVLEDGRIERLGGNRLIETDFRLICASHRDVVGMQRSGKFRHDLYYRISAVTLQLPPLRERLDDLPALIQAAMRRFVVRHDGPLPSVHPSTIDHLKTLDWPGNVRQLIHRVEQAMVFCDGEVLWPRDFSACGDGDSRAEQRSGSLAAAEGELIRTTMERLGGNKTRVAEALGISRSYLYKCLSSQERSQGRSPQAE